MGVLSKIGSFFKRIVGIKPKKKEQLQVPKSLPKEESTERKVPEGIDRITGERSTETIKKDEKQKAIEKTKEPPKEKEPTKVERIMARNKAFKSRFTYISESTKEGWNEILTRNKNIIQTGYYGNFESLMNSRYDIYRNIIMGAISKNTPEGRRLVQQIYQSGVLEEHIVAKLRMTLKVETNKGTEKLWDVEIEVQGLTPDKATRYNVFSLTGVYQSPEELRRAVEQITQTSVRENLGSISGKTEVIKIQISFNYA